MAQELELKVRINGEDIKRGVEQTRAAIRGLDKEKASILIDIKKEQLQADFQTIKAELKALSAKPITAEIEVQKQRALNDLVEIQNQLRGLQVTKVEIQVPKNTALELKAIADSFSAISGVMNQLKNDAVAAFREFDAAATKLKTACKEGVTRGVCDAPLVLLKLKSNL